LVTPVHIQPEWYFLFAYTILRSVPNKVGGVVALVISVVVLYTLPILLNHKFRSNLFYFLMKFIFWLFVVNWLLLTWIGACVVEEPYRHLGIIFSLIYFIIYLIFWLFYEIQDIVLVWL
jgi:ubiquinol-cytochrome c reductase cytochrome b subunit